VTDPDNADITVEDGGSGLATVTITPTAPWRPANVATDKLLVPESKVVPFVGAGVSEGAGLPTGADIGQRLRDEFIAPDALYPDPRTVATTLIRNGRATDREVQRCVARLYQDASARGLTPTAALSAIAGIPSKWVVTLNYDDSVEQTAAQVDVEAKSYTWKNLPPWEEAISGSIHPLNVLHLHGYWQDPETIVLDEDTYLAADA
jgi:hypothetical protein